MLKPPCLIQRDVRYPVPEATNASTHQGAGHPWTASIFRSWPPWQGTLQWSCQFAKAWTAASAVKPQRKWELKCIGREASLHFHLCLANSRCTSDTQACCYQEIQKPAARRPRWQPALPSSFRSSMVGEPYMAARCANAVKLIVFSCLEIKSGNVTGLRTGYSLVTWHACLWIYPSFENWLECFYVDTEDAQGC